MNGSRPRGMLLDVDGTLLDSNDAHARAWVETLAAHGHRVSFDQLRPLIGKGGDKLLAELLGIDEASPEGRRIGADRRERFRREHLPSLLPTRGAQALLQHLRAEGVRLAVATSAGGDELAALLRQAGVDRLVDCAATSSDAEDSKPDPDIVDAALRRLGLRAEETVMLGDTLYDIQAAKAGGVATIALRCGGWWGDDALAGAIAIHDDPAALLATLQR